MREYTVVGKRMPIVDGKEKVTGEGKFGRDMVLPGMLFGKILRSPHPHARILNIDTSKAMRLRGVKTIITGRDTPDRKVFFLPSQISTLGEKIADEYPLAKGKVRHIGESVAAVAAVDEDTALEALDLIQVEYEVLQPVLNLEEAMKAGAPLVHDEAQGNLSNRYNAAYGDVEEGFKGADYIREDRFVSQVLAHATMESHNALASFDPSSGRLTLWGSLQFLYWYRGAMAYILGIPWEKIRVIHGFVGGGFGSKAEIYSCHFCATLLSKLTSRPVKIVNYREEDFVTRLARSSMITHLKTGVKRDGTLVARQANIITSIGAYRSIGALYPRWSGYAIHVPYKVPHVKFEASMFYTNNPCYTAYRGAGMNQMFWLAESQLNTIAEDLGIDPVEIRLKNAVKPNTVTPFEWKISSCGIRECIDKATRSINWHEKRNKLGKNQGLGMANSICYSASVFSSLPLRASVRVNGDGTVTLIAVGNESGAGQYGIISQVVAEELGIPFEDVKREVGDTDVNLYEIGEHTGNHSVALGKAAQIACSNIRGKIFEIVGRKLEADVEDLEARNGRIYVKGSPSKGLSFAEASRIAIGEIGPIECMGEFHTESGQRWLKVMETGMGAIADTWSFGSAAAEVEVDEETGKVKVKKIASAYDLGFALNPLMAEGQILGGINHSMGLILSEDIALDRGQVMNPSLLDYKTVTAVDMPDEVIPILVETNDPYGPYGAKEMGLGVMFSPPGALINAVNSAIGGTIRELPLSPEKILETMEKRNS